MGGLHRHFLDILSHIPHVLEGDIGQVFRDVQGLGVCCRAFKGAHKSRLVAVSTEKRHRLGFSLLMHRAEMALVVPRMMHSVLCLFLYNYTSCNSCTCVNDCTLRSGLGHSSSECSI